MSSQTLYFISILIINISPAVPQWRCQFCRWHSSKVGTKICPLVTENLTVLALITLLNSKTIGFVKIGDKDIKPEEMIHLRFITFIVPYQYQHSLERGILAHEIQTCHLWICSLPQEDIASLQNLSVFEKMIFNSLTLVQIDRFGISCCSWYYTAGVRMCTGRIQVRLFNEVVFQ